MKATFEFDFNEPEDIRDHKRMTQSLNILMCLTDYDQYLRNQLKYNDENLSDLEYKALEEARGKLWEIIREYSIPIDDL